MSRRIPIEDIEKRIRDKHGDTVSLVRDTYINTTKAAAFIDVEYGEWTTYVMNVLVGHCHPERGKKRVQATCLEKYGATSPLGSVELREKGKETSLLRYGTESPLSSGIVRAKVKKTMLERYGVDNPQKSPEIRATTYATNVERYGAPHPYQSEELLARGRATCLENYGVDNPMKSEEVRAKGRQTNIDRYGFENPMQNEEVRKKAVRKLRSHSELEHWKTCETLQCIGSYEAALVRWLNERKIDFEWQIPFQIPDNDNIHEDIRGRVYNVDVYIKEGEYAGMYVEVKGYWMQEVSRLKWLWFHETHSNSALWTGDVLKRMGIIGKKRHSGS